MGYINLVFFMLFPFLWHLSFSSSLPHLCPKDQALALLQFKHMFTISYDGSDHYFDKTDQEIQSYPKTLSWNKSTDCCSWDGVYCDETTGKVVELNLTCSKLQVTTKGLELELTRVLTTNMIIDLSRNRFEGHIPSIIGDLVGLRTLNLSHNRLGGHIPASLQHLSILESLDLSSNKIGGGIPQQLESLTFLAVLNLSHNHLVGCIPKGKQFDTFENSSYQGNDGLRGLPLSKDCGGDEGVPQATTPFGLDQEEEGDSAMISWQAVLMGYGCGLVIGLSIIYIMLSTQYPAWFSRMDVELEHKIITRMKRHKKRY